MIQAGDHAELDIDADSALTAFCVRHGVHVPITREQIVAGRNSKVTRLTDGDGQQWILKQYDAQNKNGRDRLGAEFGFLQYLQDIGVATVARPIGMDSGLHSALYSSLPGHRPEVITSDLITQAARFIIAININAGASDPKAVALGRAADACVDWQDHLALTRIRLTQLMAMTPRTSLEEQAHALVSERFMPLWQTLETIQTMSPGVQILSPSDFGFHNTLAYQGRLSFVDFEYAGWDDAAKLACDFICQPELPVSPAQGEQFVDELQTGLPFVSALAERVGRLLPVHRLKWCCILLNEFRPEFRQRRLHAGLQSEGLQAAQLRKARDYFTTHFGIHKD